MTIFTEAGAPLKGGPNTHCEGGKQRSDAALAKYGLKEGDIVTLRDVLEVLGVSDTVFSLPFVIKQSQREARSVLLKYMAYELDIAKSLLPVLGITKYAEHMKAVEKRTLGHRREGPLQNAYNQFFLLANEEVDIPKQHALCAVAILANHTVDDHIAAVHAGIRLMDAGRSAGRGEQIRNQLEAKMRELIPTSPQDVWHTIPKGEL